MNEEKEKWIEERRKYICGSDIGAILGANPYRTAYHVWLDKTGQAAPIEETLAMKVGMHNEEFVANEFSKAQSAILVHRPFVLIHHKKYPHLACTPDRLISGRKAGLEIKCVGSNSMHRWGDEGTDNIPTEVLFQVMLNIACLDYDGWFVSALMADWTIRNYYIERNLGLEAAMLRKAEEWWEKHIVQGEEPEPDASMETRKFFESKYAIPTEEIIEADSGLSFLLEELATVKAAKKEAEETEAGLLNVFRRKIGNALGISSARYKIIWRPVKPRKEVDWKAVAESIAQKELSLNDPIVKGHITERQGYRRFDFREIRKSKEG